MTRLYNVLAGVVALVPAADEAEAIRRLTDALEAAGFSTYEGDEQALPHAFESEPGVEPDALFTKQRP